MEQCDVTTLCVLRVNRRSDVMIMLLCTEVEQMERWDFTVSCVLRVKRRCDVMIMLCVY
jgi:hypothetical protein